MHKPLNYSAFLTNFQEIKSLFPSGKDFAALGGEPYVFISLHIAEEGKGSYAQDMKALCDEVRAMGYQLIADVSKRTLEYVKKDNMIEVAKEYGVSILRPDFGFELEELIEIAKQMPICLNATNLTAEEIDAIVAAGGQVCAMHNYYPRTETGLDEEYFRQRNELLRQRNIPIMVFIAGDIAKRAPIFDGLPTLEKHRRIPPYIAYLDMVLEYGIENIYVGDGAISRSEQLKIEHFRQTGEIYIPISTISDKFDQLLFDRTYTIRDDSPRWLKRLMESRQFSTFGQRIEPAMAMPRKAGSITIDNELYSRYSGEMQIVIEDLPLDERVNVIARIPEKYLGVLPFIKNGSKIRFFKEEKEGK